MRHSWYWLLPAIVAAAACSDDSTAPGGNTNTDGRLQVIPGIPALPLVDVVVDGQRRLTNVPYGAASSTLQLSTGTHFVRVVAPGAAATAGGTQVNLSANDTTFVVVTNTTATATPAPVALGDTGATPVAGKGKLRVAHLAGNAPPIDVYRSQPDFPAFTKVQDPFVFHNASPFLESTPGNWVIRVTAKGTNTVLAESGPIRVDALWVRTVVLIDAPNGGVAITVPGGEQP